MGQAKDQGFEKPNINKKEKERSSGGTRQNSDKDYMKGRKRSRGRSRDLKR